MKARKVKGLDVRETLVENAARIIDTRLDELRSFVPGAMKRSHATDQHDMRIAAKRLRYVLEATEFCFGRPAETARRRAKDLQEVLGELHDCDVMLPRIVDQIAGLRDEDAEAVRRLAGDAPDLDPALSARAPHRTSYRGLEVLAIHVKARRRLLFERFVALWDEIERAGVWKRLERTMERSVAEARARRAAAERAARAAAALAAAEEAERVAAERARDAAAALADAKREQGRIPPPAGADGPASRTVRDGAAEAPAGSDPATARERVAAGSSNGDADSAAGP